MNKSNNCGRSMVEMLGVLAIIGVLSAGGLAGYSKAMKQHRLNKQIDQISAVFAAIVKNLEEISDSPVAANVTPYLVALGDIPPEMIKNGDKATLYDPFGNSMYVYHDTIVGRTITFYANITSMNKDNDLALLTCRNYVLAAQPYSFATNVLEFLSGYGTDNYSAAFFFKNDLEQASYTQIDQLCSKHVGAPHAVAFKIKFRY